MYIIVHRIKYFLFRHIKSSSIYRSSEGRRMTYCNCVWGSVTCYRGHKQDKPWLQTGTYATSHVPACIAKGNGQDPLHIAGLSTTEASIVLPVWIYTYMWMHTYMYYYYLALNIRKWTSNYTWTWGSSAVNPTEYKEIPKLGHGLVQWAFIQH